MAAVDNALRCDTFLEYLTLEYNPCATTDGRLELSTSSKLAAAP